MPNTLSISTSLQTHDLSWQISIGCARRTRTQHVHRIRWLVEEWVVTHRQDGGYDGGNEAPDHADDNPVSTAIHRPHEVHGAMGRLVHLQVVQRLWQQI